MRSSFVGVLLGVWVVSFAATSPAHGQASIEVRTSVAAPNATPYEGVRAAVLASHPSLRRSHAEEDAAMARVDGARVLPSPHLRGGVASVDISGARAPTMTTLELVMPIEYSGRIDASVDAASAMAEARRASTASSEIDLGIEVALRYAGALEAALVVATRRALVERAERIALLVERRLELGEGSALDAAAARLEVARSRAASSLAEGDLAQAAVALAALTGDFTEALQVTGSLRFPDAPADLSARIDHALSQRPDLRALRLAVEAAEHTHRRGERARAPELAVYLGWQHSFESLGSLFNQPEYDALLFGLDIELPVRLAWDGELREAAAELAARQAELEARELVARAEMYLAVRAHEAARARTAILEAALSDVQLAAALVTRTVELGEDRVLSVLSAERTVGEAVESYQTALGDEAQRYLELMRALGDGVERWPGEPTSGE
jgi:cobalt-zinc-cadmium efflux system outer membrane protein